MFFEQFNVGDRFQLPDIELTEEEIYNFASAFDPQLIHMDSEYAKRGLFRGVIASGFHTLCLVWKEWICLNRFGEENICGIGMDYVKWPSPVRAGDKISTIVEVTEAIPGNNCRRGMIAIKFTATNQNGNVVLLTTGRAFLKSARCKQ